MKNIQKNIIWLEVSHDAQRQARRAGVLLSGPRFSQVIVATNGQMARMHTISPIMFAKLKRWMSVQGDRDPLKRSRDGFQAEIVERLIAERLPQVTDDCTPPLTGCCACSAGAEPGSCAS